METLARHIYAAGEAGNLPPTFDPMDVAKACSAWTKLKYGVFLPKHSIGNPGGETELFDRVAPDLHRLLSEKRGTYVFKAELQQEEHGLWSSFFDALPGCAVWGYTRVETLSALKDAAESYI